MPLPPGLPRRPPSLLLRVRPPPPPPVPLASNAPPELGGGRPTEGDWLSASAYGRARGGLHESNDADRRFMPVFGGWPLLLVGLMRPRLGGRSLDDEPGGAETWRRSGLPCGVGCLGGARPAGGRLRSGSCIIEHSFSKHFLPVNQQVGSRKHVWAAAIFSSLRPPRSLCPTLTQPRFLAPHLYRPWLRDMTGKKDRPGVTPQQSPAMRNTPPRTRPASRKLPVPPRPQATYGGHATQASYRGGTAFVPPSSLRKAASSTGIAAGHNLHRGTAAHHHRSASHRNIPVSSYRQAHASMREEENGAASAIGANCSNAKQMPTTIIATVVNRLPAVIIDDGASVESCQHAGASSAESSAESSAASSPMHPFAAAIGTGSAGKAVAAALSASRRVHRSDFSAASGRSGMDAMWASRCSGETSLGWGADLQRLQSANDFMRYRPLSVTPQRPRTPPHPGLLYVSSHSGLNPFTFRTQAERISWADVRSVRSPLTRQMHTPFTWRDL